MIRFIKMVTQNTLIQGRLAGLCYAIFICLRYLCSYLNFLYFSAESDIHSVKDFSSSSRIPDTLHGLVTYCCCKNTAEKNIGKRLPSHYFFSFFWVYYHKATQMVLYCFILTVCLLSLLLNLEKPNNSFLMTACLP